MSNLHVQDSGEILLLSVESYMMKNRTLSFGKELISLNKYRESKKNRVSNSKMNYFLLTKYRSVEENVLFTAKVLYELLEEKSKHIDQLFLEFAEEQGITINLNVERILYLALTFLFSLKKVTINENMIEKLENGA
jgi:hypothetical protein